MVLFDFIPKMGENYYLQVFLEECKYIVKEKEVARHVNGKVEFLMIQMNLMDNIFSLINGEESPTDMKNFPVSMLSLYCRL